MPPSLPALHTPILVIGSGLAGCMAALAAAKGADVLLITKGDFNESASWHAQGGIAAALAKDDSLSCHLGDTRRAGCDICDIGAVGAMVIEGVTRCRELLAWGVPFDRDGADLAFALEAGHRRRRVLRAHGDGTGAAIIAALRDKIDKEPRIQTLERHMALRLLHLNGACYGVMALDIQQKRLLDITAHSTILATGGWGRVFGQTTNPAVSTGDGCAMAIRAGAHLRDMEFYQFHPTALCHPDAPRFLISEAARGEGARLIDAAGNRFMHAYHSDGDMAPRDVVSRSIETEIAKNGEGRVWLDFRHLDPERARRRFPNIDGACARLGIDLTRHPVPVRPAAHYSMGGIATDLHGRTSVKGLFAAGETACTGAHGANRLASNSLLECAVYGHRAGERAILRASAAPEAFGPETRRAMAEAEDSVKWFHDGQNDESRLSDIGESVALINELAWKRLGIFRDEDGLAELLARLPAAPPHIFPAREETESDNMALVAEAIGHAARRRAESRGAHARTDYPFTDPAFRRPVTQFYDGAWNFT